MLPILLALMLHAADDAPPRLDPAGDTRAQFPSLRTTLVDPQADRGPLTAPCATLGGRRLCEMELVEAYCLAQGFAGAEDFETGPIIGPPAAGTGDPGAPRRFVRVTCRRPPIVDN